LAGIHAGGFVGHGTLHPLEIIAHGFAVDPGADMAEGDQLMERVALVIDGRPQRLPDEAIRRQYAGANVTSA
jgi:hypothetical protein